MSNGPYGQQACRCGAVSLLVCGEPLGQGRDKVGRPVTFWPLESLQIAQGVDELVAEAAGVGGLAQACRRCGEVLLVEHAELEVVALWAEVSEGGPAAAPLATATRQRLEALGYRLSN